MLFLSVTTSLEIISAGSILKWVLATTLRGPPPTPDGSYGLRPSARTNGSVLDRGGYESAYFLRRRRNNWTRNASAVPTTTSTMVNILDELEGDGLRFSPR